MTLDGFGFVVNTASYLRRVDGRAANSANARAVDREYVSSSNSTEFDRAL